MAEEAPPEQATPASTSVDIPSSLSDLASGNTRSSDYEIPSSLASPVESEHSGEASEQRPLTSPDVEKFPTVVLTLNKDETVRYHVAGSPTSPEIGSNDEDPSTITGAESSQATLVKQKPSDDESAGTSSRTQRTTLSSRNRAQRLYREIDSTLLHPFWPIVARRSPETSSDALSEEETEKTKQQWRIVRHEIRKKICMCISVYTLLLLGIISLVTVVIMLILGKI